jgi:hypothetical protein
MLVKVEKEISKYQKAVAEYIKLAEEKEKVYPITYKCPKCKDKKCFVWWKDGYEYGRHCECYYEEKAREREEREEKEGRK